MGFIETGEIKYFRFDIFNPDDIVQGIFTRHGGTSPYPYRSLNVGGTVGDSPENVIENRQRMFSAIQRLVGSIYDVWQVHGKDISIADRPRNLQIDLVKSDAIITNQPDVTLFMRFADCVPIFLYDPIKKIIGLVHAGWPGTVKKIGADAVRAMETIFGSTPKDLQAGIGPSIGMDHYEIGKDVCELIANSFDKLSERMITKSQDKVYLNLWEANKIILQQVGVESIEVAGICTVCHNEDWFSHRGEKGKTGRFGAIFALK